MGNGLKANFVLEMGINSSNGNLDGGSTQGAAGNVTQLFQRLSTVGLSGASWGAVNFGRQYTPLFWNVQAPNDLFRVAGVGSIYSLTNVGITRASNSIKYDSADMSGFSVSAMYALGNTGAVAGSTGNVSTDAPLAAPLVGSNPANLGRQAGISGKYANGPLSLAIAYNRLNIGAITPVLNTFDTMKTTAATGSYDFKVVAIQAGWQENKISNNLQDRSVWNVGATMPVGNDLVKLQYSDRKDKLVNNGSSKLWALGYVHPLSKRTVAYATYAKMRNDNNVAQGLIFGAAGVNVTNGYSPDGLQLGLQHAF
jgi:predicted porin